MTGDKVIPLIDNEMAKCPSCNHRVVSRYRLENESDDEAVCGDCFGEWLVRVGGTIHT